jgi:hypothetical protein
MRHTGFLPGISIDWAPRLTNRDGRNKSGHDVSVLLDFANPKRQQLFFLTRVLERITGLI